MTNIALERVSYQVEKRGWLWGEHGTEPGANPTITLDFTATGGFVEATHFPNGYVPSGVVLGKITASGAYGVYDPAATNGREKAAGLLFSSVSVPTNKATKIGAVLFPHGFVDPNRLPFKGGAGALDNAAKTALNLIHFA